MIVKAHATALVRMPRGGKRAKPLADAFKALALASNNLANVAIEIASRVLESHRDGKLMPEAVLTDRQKAAIALANAAIDKANATRGPKNERKAAHNASLAPGEEAKNPSRIFARMGENDSSPWDIIDISILDQACRLHRDETGGSPYEALSACEAPLVAVAIAKSFARYRKGDAGHPKPRKSGSSRVLEFAGWSLRRPANRLPPLSKLDGTPRPLFLDRAKTMPLSQEARDAYEDLDCKALAAKFRKILRVDESNSEFLSMRLTHKNGSAWLEGVFEMDVKIPDGSLMAQGLSAIEAAKNKKKAAKEKKLAEVLAQKAGQDAERAKAEGQEARAARLPTEKELAKSVKKLDLAKAETDGLLAEILAQACRGGKMPSVAGLDLGVTNIATAAFSTGRKAVVISGGPFEMALGPLDAKMALRKSILAKAPAIATLQAKLSAKAITSQEKAHLERLLSEAYSKDPILQGFEEKRANVVRDSMHQLASAVADFMATEGIQAVVVGRNAGWKECSDMGSEENRRFHAIPHAMFIRMLRHKLRAHGILLVEVEESYTSETSFASNEPLKAYSGSVAKAPAEAAPKKLPAQASPFVRDPVAAAKAAEKASKKAERAEKSRIAKQAKEKIQKEQRKNGAQMARDAGGAKPPPAPSPAATAWPEGDRRPGSRVAARKGSPKNRFDTQGQGRWSSIHADANGAYNILRKACPGFRRNAALSSAFEIMSTGPGGLRRIQQSTLKGQRTAAKCETVDPFRGSAEL